MDAPGVHTFGTRLAHARANIREALALWLDTDAATLEIEDDIRLPDGAHEAMDELDSARVASQQARDRLRDATVSAAWTLADAGIATRDAAELLDLSHQRISQVLSRDGGT